MVAPVVAQFRFADVAPKDQDWLRGRTEDLHDLTHRTVCDLVRIGRLLAEVRDRIRKRKFRGWLAAHTPISRPQAYRFISVARAFGPYLSQRETERIEPTALYILSQPSTPPAARAHAVDLAAGGERVTAATAREVIDAHRPVPDLPPAELRRAEADAARLRTRMEAVRAVTDPAPLARVGAAVLALARSGVLFYVSVLAEGDGEGCDDPVYSVTAHVPRPGGPPVVRTEVRRALVDALEAVLGREELAECPTCRGKKPVSQFGRNKRTPTGRSRYCMQCERKRIARVKASTRAAKRPAPQAVA